ncbi:putative RNA uridine N3 methyltransferase [Methanosphaera stadtmanae]|uniref:RNA-binding protein n=1 Tax=Methanosphaera stadtmanae TaxID=2317 RepID=A0A328Q633_9EURY|nr:RNA-binding protein [Methanosphaera stadtmanae]
MFFNKFSIMEKLSIFVPNSFLAESKDSKIRTYKVGLIGRYAALFRANNIVIYNDNSDGGSRDDALYMKTILEYMDTPQYLRKQVFPITPELKNVGILPPLRTPHHPATDEANVGDFRKGLTTKRVRKGTIVDIGVGRLALCKEKLSVNKVLSFRIEKLGKEILIEPDEPDSVYWGYDVITSDSNLYDSITMMKNKPDLVIGTSKYAPNINSILDEVQTSIQQANHVAILFGGPYSGINSLINERKLDYEVNTVPKQGTETVRTEEAVASTLAILNILLN